MTININLLPSAYRKARCRDRWYRQGVRIGIVLIAMEICAGFVLHLCSYEKGELVSAIDKMHDEIDIQKRNLAEATSEGKRYQTNIALSKGLRTTHRWSRLTAALAKVTPPNITLTCVGTDPMKWSPVAAAMSSGGNTRTEPAMNKDNKNGGKSGDDVTTRNFVKYIIVSGFAEDHQALSEFMTRLHSSGLFAGVDLQRMQRELKEGREVISFDLQGRW